MTLEPGADEGIGAGCADSSLEAAPVVTTADGRVIVLADDNGMSKKDRLNKVNKKIATKKEDGDKTNEAA